MENRATNKLDVLQLQIVQSGEWTQRRQDEVTERNRIPHIGSLSHGIINKTLEYVLFKLSG